MSRRINNPAPGFSGNDILPKQYETVREAYIQSTENLKSYMQRQWSPVGGMTGAFREME
ncbi:hypothetical protein AALB47_18855 [Lachnospiraceae bacterium 54-11]